MSDKVSHIKLANVRLSMIFTLFNYYMLFLENTVYKLLWPVHTTA